ncbi:M48 family metalloprotease [Actinoplanes missouriensis]|uniref:M48 family metalloprotease n=1 Tax=Actinoplanes missouriensis TaxID=1866 RepID=UPI0033C7C0F3
MSDDLCPECATPTISERSAEPWCPSCEWNLDRFDPEHGRHLGWARVDRRLYRAAYWLTARQFAELAGGPAAGASKSAARLVTIAASALLLAGEVALVVLGVWLLLKDFFSPVNILGVLVLAVAVVLRPRLGRLRDLTAEATEVDRGTAPALFGLIERVAAATGAPMPDVVLMGAEQNAYTVTVGLRRRRVLYLGAPLWAVLDPQERVALVGHELGHFVNGDVRRGLLTQSARSTLGQVAYLLTPDRGGDLVAQIVEFVGWVFSRLALGFQLLLLWTSLRDSQRAEYLADELAAKAGGSAATIRLLDSFLITDAVDTVVRREARAKQGAEAWRAAAGVARTRLEPQVAAMRQLSRRTDVSLFASHPPAGLRAALTATRPEQPAAVVLPETDSARIDEELAAHYERARRELATA